MSLEQNSELAGEWPSVPEPYSIDQFLDLVSDSAKIDRGALVPSAKLIDLNIASLDMVDILFEVEERFGIYVPMGDELDQVDTLGDLVKMLADLIREGATAPEAEA